MGNQDIDDLEFVDDEHKEAYQEIQKDDYHLRGDAFKGEKRWGKMLVVGEDEDPLEAAKRQSRYKQTKKLGEAIAFSLNSARVPDPTGSQFLKVSFKEYVAMREDPEFVPFAQYGQNLILYADGTPRPRPIRPIVQSEVGTYRGQIVYLKDAGPDDYGEGKYYQVPKGPSGGSE